MEIQSLVFDDSRFTLAEARAWAKKNGFKFSKPDIETNTIRFRQRDPEHFVKASFRMMGRPFPSGVQAVVACPRPGHESDKSKRRHRANASKARRKK